jgi:predicted enzyme related to lactoylglutathione lyase
MRRHLVPLAAIVVGGLFASVAPAGATASNATRQAGATTTTAPPTTLPIDTAPSTQPTGEGNPAATGQILMIKLPVGNLAAAERFYGTVFGAKVAVSVGANAHIVTFPSGGPGLVLLKRNPKEKNRTGAFIIKVPDLDASLSLALANGATKQGAFAGTPANQVAHSVDTLDPWGNQVEILQIG